MTRALSDSTSSAGAAGLGGAESGPAVPIVGVTYIEGAQGKILPLSLRDEAKRDSYLEEQRGEGIIGKIGRMERSVELN